MEEEFSEDFGNCVEFHGHVCPGLSIGYRAGQAGLDYLGTERSEDEELVAVTETDACGVDAVQVLTGCTLGKGNLVLRDLGKQAFTFILRPSGEGVRLVMNPGAFEPGDRHRELLELVKRGEASEQQREEFFHMHREASRRLLRMPLQELFRVQKGKFPLPEKARVESSERCAACEEPAMRSKMVSSRAGLLCRDCAERGD